MEDGAMVLGMSVVLLIGTVLAGQWLDARAVRRSERKQRKQRPLVPDFTKVKR